MDNQLQVSSWQRQKSTRDFERVCYRFHLFGWQSKEIIVVSSSVPEKKKPVQYYDWIHDFQKKKKEEKS